MFGFRFGKSTIDAITHLTTDINKAFLSKEHLVAAFIDIDSAFLGVHIPALADILIHIGIPSHVSQFISLMFVNRSISMSTNAGVSIRNSYLGLAHGFPLYPSLFNIYAIYLAPEISGAK